MRIIASMVHSRRTQFMARLVEMVDTLRLAYFAGASEVVRGHRAPAGIAKRNAAEGVQIGFVTPIPPRPFPRKRLKGSQNQSDAAFFFHTLLVFTQPGARVADL